jgi:hypothetical protein
VNLLTANGLSLEQAARRSWTGSQAEKYGFTEVTIDKDPPLGTAGNCKPVIVEFTKP